METGEVFVSMSWTCLSDGQRKARKGHRCLCCNALIEIGDTYHVRTGIDCDGWVDMKMHLKCAEVTHEWDSDDWEAFEPGSMERPRMTLARKANE